MNVYQKLQAARIKLQNTKLSKSGHNKFAGYQYFELGDFLPTIQALFSELGLCGAVSFSSDVAVLTITNCDKPDEVIVFSSPMAEANLKGCHPIQNLGAVQTYQRRYLWVTALEIVEHDALDATTGNEEKVKTPNHKPVSRETFDSLAEDVKISLRDKAMNIISFLEKGLDEDAVCYLEALNLDADLKVGIWSLLDSKQRAAIKKATASKV
jgi:hypothetical protein